MGGGVLASSPRVPAVSNSVNLLEGTVDVFGRGPDKHVWHKHQYTTKEGLSWTKWFDLGALTSTAPSGLVRGDGTLQLFVRGSDKAIWTRWQENNNGTMTWSHWLSLGGNVKSYVC